MKQSTSAWALSAGMAAVAWLSIVQAETAASFSKPARFKVTDEVVQKDIGPFSIVEDYWNWASPLNCVFNAPYEPLTFTMRMIASEDAQDFFTTERMNDEYNNGVMDGAAVRIFRVRGGKLVLVREDTIAPGGYQAETWREIDSGGVLMPLGKGTTITFNFNFLTKPDSAYWFALQAVGKNARKSELSAPVEARSPKAYVERLNNNHLFMTGLDVKNAKLIDRYSTNTVVPPAPKNLRIVSGNGTPTVTLAWDAAADTNALAGYYIFMSSVAPRTLGRKGFKLLGTGKNAAAPIKKGDLAWVYKERLDWNKEQCVNPARWGVVDNAVGCMFFEDNPADTTKRWRLVPHPDFKPHAKPAELGRTCLEVNLKQPAEVSSTFWAFSGTEQDRYPVLKRGTPYVVEAWLKQTGTGGVVQCRFVSLSETPVTFQPTTVWKKHRAVVTFDKVLEKGSSVGALIWTISGQGTFWLDNLRVYEERAGFLDYMPEDVAEMKAAKMKYMRTHSLAKTLGYSVEQLTSPPGAGEYMNMSVRNTCSLGSLLPLMRTAGCQPWLQIEMNLLDKDLLSIVEYLAAPYDPAKDTPEKKPWAWKRYHQGQRQPWSEVFDHIIWEISNETWNGGVMPLNFVNITMIDEQTGEPITFAKLYAAHQEHVIAMLKSSPYWPALVKKIEFMIGGWSINTYGSDTARLSTNSAYVSIAAYNGGWDEQESLGDKPNDPDYFKTLTQSLNLGNERSRFWAAEQAKAAATGIYWKLAVYEAGPGYVKNGLNGAKVSIEAVRTQDAIMKSLAGGTATLAAFLDKAYYGFKEQCFFIHGRSRLEWNSHARWYDGGQAYPCWRSLALFNNYGAGDFLKVDTVSVPAWDLPQSNRRVERKDAPMISAYATRNGDRLTVFLLSHKLDNYPVAGNDGYTPLTLDLPIKSAKKATLYRLAGPPRAHNLDADKVKVVKIEMPADLVKPEFVLSAKTGADDRGLPPAATFAYVFDGITGGQRQ